MSTSRFGSPGDTEPPLLDVRASNARTALTDPEGLPEPIASALALSDTDPETDPYRAYALDQLDELINLLNPAEFTRESFAATLTILGRHLAERQGELDYNATQASETDAPDDALALRVASVGVGEALDGLDAAISALMDKN